MTTHDEHSALGDEFDRAVRKFHMQQDAVQAGPSNERILSQLVNIAQDWTVTTYRARIEKDRGGKVSVTMEDTILITKGERDTYTRLVIPPEIARLIARQYDQLSTKNRKRGARQAMETRKASGYDPAETMRKARSRRGKKVKP